MGLPVGAAAIPRPRPDPHEVTLVQLTFALYMIEAKPENLIGDRAYDSDQLNEQLRAQGTEMIASHRSERMRKDQGRPTVAPLRASLDRRAPLRVDSVATLTPRPLGVLPSQFPRLRAACSAQHSAQAVLRSVLAYSWC